LLKLGKDWQLINKKHRNLMWEILSQEAKGAVG
jgi:hypothetical protein